MGLKRLLSTSPQWVWNRISIFLEIQFLPYSWSQLEAEDGGVGWGGPVSSVCSVCAVQCVYCALFVLCSNSTWFTVNLLCIERASVPCWWQKPRDVPGRARLWNKELNSCSHHSRVQMVALHTVDYGCSKYSVFSRPGQSQGLLYKHLRHYFI